MALNVPALLAKLTLPILNSCCGLGFGFIMFITFSISLALFLYHFLSLQIFKVFSVEQTINWRSNAIQNRLFFPEILFLWRPTRKNCSLVSWSNRFLHSLFFCFLLKHLISKTNKWAWRHQSSPIPLRFGFTEIQKCGVSLFKEFHFIDSLHIKDWTKLFLNFFSRKNIYTFKL